jgi:hypothetical protein
MHLKMLDVAILRPLQLRQWGRDAMLNAGPRLRGQLTGVVVNLNLIAKDLALHATRLPFEHAIIPGQILLLMVVKH